MIDRETAVSLAAKFLSENAPGAELLSVRSEEDGWFISARADNGETLLVYLDIDDARPMFFSEDVVDVDLSKPLELTSSIHPSLTLRTSAFGQRAERPV